MDASGASALASSMADAREPQPELGRAIRRIRERSGMSQETLAHRAGIHPTWISKIERGHNNPAWGTVRHLAAALDVSLLELVAVIERIELE
jgi:transcriptional regulator with XRE-family HTH domain